MRRLIGYTILLAASLSSAQTSQEFHSRYGDPDIERFKVRDGIGLTVLYGSDGLACQMEIKPLSLLYQRPSNVLMTPAVVDEIVNEFVPPDRGKRVEGDGLEQRMGCSASLVEKYETVTILRAINHCDKGSVRDASVDIVFTREGCPKTGFEPSMDKTLFQKGLHAYKMQEYREACSAFQTILTLYPRSEFASRAQHGLELAKCGSAASSQP